MQSPVMVVVQDAETIAYLEKWNAEIMGNPDGHPFYGAPTVVTVLAGVFVMGDPFTLTSLIAFAMILTGVWGVNIFADKK